MVGHHLDNCIRPTIRLYAKGDIFSLIARQRILNITNVFDALKHCRSSNYLNRLLHHRNTTLDIAHTHYSCHHTPEASIPHPLGGVRNPPTYRATAQRRRPRRRSGAAGGRRVNAPARNLSLSFMPTIARRSHLER